MKTIGIITWYWGNYGSILQAYALQQYLLQAGFECKVVNHHVNGDFATQMKFRLSHDGFFGVLSAGQKKVSSIVWGAVEKNNRKIRQLAFNKFIEENIVLSENYFSNNNYRSCLDYDIYICGSDQIWNPSFTFLSPFYWLSFLPENKERIAYAPSMGTAILNEKDKKIVRDYLLPFKAISTRELNSGKLLEALDERICVTHVSDPTLLLDAAFWKSKLKNRKTNQKYLFAYLIKGNDKQRAYISSIAAKLGLELVVYPYLENHYIDENEKKWGDVRCFEEDPFDFLTKIYYADLVITDSFHCSVFSLLFHKDFYTLKKSDDKTSQFNRISQLLSACHAEERIISEEKPFRRVKCSFGKTDEAIHSLRSESREFLKKALS